MLTGKAKLFLSLTAASALVFAACTGNSINNPMVGASGTYQLAVFADKSIPVNYTIQPGDPNYPQYPNGATFSVTGGTMVLNSNGTFVETDTYVTTPTGGTQNFIFFVSKGTWTLNGIKLTIYAPPQNNLDARYGDGTLDVNTINYAEVIGTGIQRASQSGEKSLLSYEYKR